MKSFKQSNVTGLGTLSKHYRYKWFKPQFMSISLEIVEIRKFKR